MFLPVVVLFEQKILSCKNDLWKQIKELNFAARFSQVQEFWGFALVVVSTIRMTSHLRSHLKSSYKWQLQFHVAPFAVTQSPQSLPQFHRKWSGTRPCVHRALVGLHGDFFTSPQLRYQLRRRRSVYPAIGAPTRCQPVEGSSRGRTVSL